MAIPAPAVRPMGGPRERDRTRLTDRLAPRGMSGSLATFCGLVHLKVLLISEHSYLPRIDTAGRGGGCVLLASVVAIALHRERNENFIPHGLPEEPLRTLHAGAEVRHRRTV